MRRRVSKLKNKDVQSNFEQKVGELIDREALHFVEISR